jgi:hypothetical protein
LLTSGTCGLISIGSSASAALMSSLVSSLQAQQALLGSTLYSLTWKVKVTPQGRQIHALRAGVRRTSDNGCTSWVTPAARDWKDTPGMSLARVRSDRETSGRTDQLARQAYLAGWPTATACDSNRHPAVNFAPTPNMTLNHAAVLAGWPTPTASLGVKGVNPDPEAIIARNKLKGQDLGAITSLAGWPTPTASMQTMGDVVQAMSAGNRSARTSYQDANQNFFLGGWPTPTCQTPQSLRGKGQDPFKRKDQGRTVDLTSAIHYIERDSPARLTVSGEMLIGFSAGTSSGGQLSPEHSRWLMGIPIEWSFCAVTAMQSMRASRKASSSRPSKQSTKGTKCVVT